MALAAMVAALTDIPEALQGEYSEITEGTHKGKYLLSVTASNGFALEDVAGLKTSLSKERALKSAAEKKASAWGDLEHDDVTTKLEQLAKLEELSGDDKGKLEAQLAAQKVQMEKSFGTDRTKWTEREKFLESEVSRLLVRARGASSCAGHKADHEMLEPHIARMVQALEIDDPSSQYGKRFVARVRGDEGAHRLTTKEGSTDFMGVDELVDKVLREKFPAAYDGHGNRGSGSGGSGGGGGGGSANGSHVLSAEEARKPAVYRAAKAAAEKAGADLRIAAT